MYVDLVGVLDDGTRPFAPGVPPDTRRAIRVVRGDHLVVRVRLVDPVGAPIRLAIDAEDEDADQLVLHVRTPVEPGQPGARQLLTGVGVAAVGRGPGCYDITIPSATIRVIPAQAAVWDMWVIRLGRSHCVVGSSMALITSSQRGAS